MANQAKKNSAGFVKHQQRPEDGIDPWSGRNSPRIASLAKHQQLVLPTRPRYIPLPPEKGIDPWSGLKRGKLKTLILPSLNDGKPPVKSIRIPNRGQNKRAVRLICLDSLFSYLKNLEQQQAV